MKKTLPLIALLFLLVIIIGIRQADGFIRTGTGYMAKVLCSEIFIAGRTEADLKASEFDGIHPMLEKISTKIDEQKRTVKASLFGVGKSKAVFRDNVGCTLSIGNLAALPDLTNEITPKPWVTALATEPNANSRVDYAFLQAAITGAFSPENPLNHRAILVAVDGKLVYEQYADGFNAQTPLLSWSAAKSITATLIGIAAEKYGLDVNGPIPVEEWAADNDRNKLTWDDLLGMESGLDFNEDYADTSSDVNRMLFKANSTASIPVKNHPVHKPGKVFYYSSGTTNLLARETGDIVEAQGSDLLSFSREYFLKPLGLSSTTLEVDSVGDFIGSSYVYATGRDWLKMGQLYLQDGVWEGERLLPETWDDYVAQPTIASDNQYGAHFWLNRDGLNDQETGKHRPRFFAGMPEEVYFFAGRDGQYVVIVPDKNMVIVRLGLTRDYPVIPKVAPLFKEIYDSVSSN